MNIQHKTRLIWLAIAVAWIFDLLFWQKTPGISFFILVVITLAVGYFISRSEGIQPGKNSWFLLIPILYFSTMTIFREEPFTTFINYLLTVGAMALLAFTYTGGKWWNYSLSDYVVNAFRFFLSTISKSLLVFAGKEKNNGTDVIDGSNLQVKGQKGKTGWSIVRGTILALPIMLLLAALLAAADPIFDQKFQELLKIFNIDKLSEYLFRLFYILILAYLLAGAYLHALTSSRDEQLIGLEKPWLPPFLGWIESIIILLGIDLLFGFFVGIQFQYFFGGTSNIHIDGYTFAEYARKGFSELVAVAMISLLIMQILNSISRRKTGKQSTIFTAFSVGLVALVSIILVSAFHRLQLYEAAYGFSRLRTYTHVFMIWSGLLLAATVVIEVLKKTRLFALALVIAIWGFGISLNSLNVDRFIAIENIDRAMEGSELDIPYLVSLSNDVVPTLYDSLQNGGLSEEIKDQVGISMACKTYLEQQSLEDRDDEDLLWSSYTYPHDQANRLFLNFKDQPPKFKIKEDEYNLPYVVLKGERIYCSGYSSFD